MGQPGQQMDPNVLLQAYGQYLMQQQPGASTSSSDQIGNNISPLGNGPLGTGTGPDSAPGFGGPGGGMLNGSNQYTVTGNGPLETWGHNMQQGQNNHPIIAGAANYATGGLSGKLGQLMGHMYNPNAPATVQAGVPGSVTNNGLGDTFGPDALSFLNGINPGLGLGASGGGLFGGMSGAGHLNDNGGAGIYGNTTSPWDWGTNAY